MVQQTVDIGTLIIRTPDIRGGRPRIVGTGVTVQRVGRRPKDHHGVLD